MDATTRIEALSAPVPKRIAAQSRRGRGAKISMEMWLATATSRWNTSTHTNTTPKISTTASNQRSKGDLRNHENLWRARNKAVGTTVRLAIMLEASRMIHK